MRIFKCDVSKKSIKNWKTLADDFITELSTNNKSSEKIGVGHSMGGTILLYSAIKMPNFFRKLFYWIQLFSLLFSAKCGEL